jgi:flagellar motor switch protein FliM
MAAEMKQDAPEIESAKGVELLVNKSLDFYPRFPMFDIIYDRFIRDCSGSLRAFTSDNVDLEITKDEVDRFGAYFEQLPQPGILVIFKAVEWDNYGIMSFSGEMVYAFMEVLFGGKRVPPLKVEGRPFTKIEVNLVRTISEIILNDFSRSFDNIAATTFNFERTETNPRFAMIVRPEDVIAALQFKVKMDSRSGTVDLLLPYLTLEPAKKVLSKSYLGQKVGTDPNWMRHFEKEINKSRVTLDVVIHSTAVNLHTIAGLQVGKTVILDKTADAEWDIEINKVKVSCGSPGKLGTQAAIQLSDAIHVLRYKEE